METTKASAPALSHFASMCVNSRPKTQNVELGIDALKWQITISHLEKGVYETEYAFTGLHSSNLLSLLLDKQSGYIPTGLFCVVSEREMKHSS